MASRTVSGGTDTPSATDAAGQILCTSVTAVTVTFPASVFTAGQAVTIWQMGAGQVTLAAGAGATMRSPNGTKSAGQYRAMVVTYVSGAEFIVGGDVKS